MKTKHFLKTIFAMGLLAVTAIGCEPLEGPVVEELDLTRTLMPTDLTARIRNVTSIELDWYVRDDAEGYIVEFAEGENDFSNIVRTVEVAPEDVPLREDDFAGETFYSIRVKSVSQSNQDSNWATVVIQTDPEQIFYPLADCDVQATEAYLAWPPESAVTHFIITPGDINRPITPAEMASGMATLTGLSGDTDYTVTLYNNTAVRGFREFTTLTTAGTMVETTDDISAVIAAAADGDVLLLSPGEHNMFSGDLTIDKSLTIRGFSPCDKPILSVSFTMAPGLQDLILKDLELNGDAGNISTLVQMSNPGSYNSVDISGCFIHDYGRQLIYSNTTGALLNNFLVDNSIVTDFLAGGGDFIDFRSGDVHNITLTNSTFVYTPASRDFIRADASGDTNGTGVTLTILVDHCTLFNVSSGRRIAYVRFANNDITLTNNLFANSTVPAIPSSYYSNQSSTDDEMTFENNNYFNTERLYDSSETRYDDSDNYFTLDPGFADEANRDFTVTNPDVRDENIGDPRWLN